MSDDILGLEGFLPYRLYRLADLVSREFAAVYKVRLGLTRPEWRVLAGLGQHGSMTATALGRHSAMHKTKVSRAVAALERRRWLARRQDPADRRVEHLELTRAGLAAYAAMVPLARAFELDLLKRLPAGARRTLDTSLREIEACLVSPAASDSERAAGSSGGRRRAPPD